ncbi:helix-turn-helix transcriptional regulator [Novosphingobium piscinae]|uniref:Helix-turn-helix domain-containing protein n=1 Tax=Novosphingobium piscinae TaxID=1507448 RepID=A0A7X1G040_9SPHN|nr:helix-turn-helix domain-containing protein [Novosphingobium piscinae]MBC2669517.1 helix-turn-helix domain-containing protein [Novosphingobium piscinae]
MTTKAVENSGPELSWDNNTTAEFLGCHPGHLARLRVTGESPPYFRVGKKVRYDPADVRAWINARKRRSTSEAT